MTFQSGCEVVGAEDDIAFAPTTLTRTRSHGGRVIATKIRVVSYKNSAHHGLPNELFLHAKP
jgi:hypothetical protein